MPNYSGDRSGGNSGKKYGNRGFGGGAFRGGSGGGFKGRNSFGGRPEGRPSMHRATCDECGNPCEVPFKPTSGKPLYCHDCFKKNGGPDMAPRRSEGRDYDRPSYAPKESSGKNSNNNLEQFKKQFDILNDKLDKISNLLLDLTADPDVSEDLPEEMDEEMDEEIPEEELKTKPVKAPKVKKA